MENGKIEVLAHPTYSPDLTLGDFWCFGALIWKLRNRHFESDVKLVTAIKHFFQALSPEEFHKTMTAKWKERMLVCIADDCGFFEKEIADRDDEDGYIFFTSKTHSFTFARGRQTFFFSNTHISAMRRATMFRLHSIDRKLNKVSDSFFFFGH